MRAVSSQFAVDLLRAGLTAATQGAAEEAIVDKARELLAMNYPSEDILKAVAELKAQGK